MTVALIAGHGVVWPVPDFPLASNPDRIQECRTDMERERDPSRSAR